MGVKITAHIQIRVKIFKMQEKTCVQALFLFFQNIWKTTRFQRLEAQIFKFYQVLDI